MISGEQILGTRFLRGGFKKITPVNGFDESDADNAKQNNYAWSMAELGEYIYVGTGRNIAYTILRSGLFPDVGPSPFDPEKVDMHPEIWRYKKDGSRPWERVYKASPDSGLAGLGFRFMLPYTTPAGETALYVGCTTFGPRLVILKSIDGEDWVPLYTDIVGNSTRAMVVHEGKLYMGVVSLALGEPTPRLYVSSDPEREGWQLIDMAGDPDKNPRGGIDVLCSFNGHLYVGTELPGGFELWRTRGRTPQKNDWKLVVDKGAGDALNQIPVSATVFRDHIYLGTGIWGGILSIDPTRSFVPPKGFDVVRIDREDRWELVVGGPPILPTRPATGIRGEPLSGFSSGFGNLTNAYCWQIQTHGTELYIGTFDQSVAYYTSVPMILRLLATSFPYDGNNYLAALKNYLLFLSHFEPMSFLFSLGNLLSRISLPLLKALESNLGFDLWKSYDGLRWFPISLDGLGNRYNYGARTLFSASNGALYLGTANPYQGCEIWVKS